MSRTIAKSITALLTLTVAIWFCSCGGAKVVQVQTDPAFTYEAASSSSICVVGVVSSVGDDNYRDEIRESLPHLLAERIAKTRTDLAILDPRQIEEALGKERQRELLDYYRQSGRLDTASVIALFDATRGLARHVILARIYMDSIARVKTEDNISIDHKTLRHVKMSFNVYDISTASLVFDESITHEDFDLQVDSKGDAPDDDCSSALSFVACILDFFSWFSDKDDEGFPPPPELEDIVTVIFDRFAETLPQAPSG